MNNPPIFKIVDRMAWAAAEANGTFDGAQIDLDDGFIHFSTAQQVAETAARHFRDRDDLLLVEVDSAVLGSALRWEPSRGGELFPHLYSSLSLSAVRAVSELPRDSQGLHILPWQN